METRTTSPEDEFTREAYESFASVPVRERDPEIRRGEIIAGNDLVRRAMCDPSRVGMPFWVHATDSVIYSDLSMDVFRACQSYDQFTADVDINGLHDQGRIEIAGEIFYFRIEYFSPDWMRHVNPFSEEPARKLTLYALLDA